MTSADYALLSADEKKGLINVTDESGYAFDADDIAYDETYSTKQKIDLIPKFVTASGQFADTIGTFNHIDYPTGYNSTNSYIVGFEIYMGGWRTGQGIANNNSCRSFALLSQSYIDVYTDDNDYKSLNVRITLMKY